MTDDQIPTPVAEQPPIERVVQALVTDQCVSIPFEVNGKQHEVMIRHKNGIYRCETPLRLRIHETDEQLENWLLDQGDVTSE